MKVFFLTLSIFCFACGTKPIKRERFEWPAPSGFVQTEAFLQKTIELQKKTEDLKKRIAKLQKRLDILFAESEALCAKDLMI